MAVEEKLLTKVYKKSKNKKDFVNQWDSSAGKGVCH